MTSECTEHDHTLDPTDTGHSVNCRYDTDPGPVPPAQGSEVDLAQRLRIMALTDTERASMLNYLTGYAPDAVSGAADYIAFRRIEDRKPFAERISYHERPRP